MEIILQDGTYLSGKLPLLIAAGLIAALVAFYSTSLYGGGVSLSLGIFPAGVESGPLWVPPDAEWTYHPLEYIVGPIEGTCLSLKERHIFYPKTDLAPSQALLEALRKYEARHQRCVNNVSSWPDHFEKLQQGLEDCKYIVWLEDTGGLGNRFMSITAAFEYALITDRVLLVEPGKLLKELLCDPIPDSSIWLPDAFPMTELLKAPQQREFFKGKTTHEGEEDKHRRDILYIYLRHDMNDWEGNGLFYCGEYQATIANVTWFLWDSNQYVTPGYYLVPSLEKRLNELYPDHLSTTRSMRYLILPSNNVWKRVSRVHRTYLAFASSRIGIQVRTFGSYDARHNERMVQCMINEGAIPRPTSETEWDQLSQDINWLEKQKAAGVISLFVASLDIGYFEYLKQLYTDRPTADGRLVAVHVESHDGIEQHVGGNEEHALAEIFLLSFSDILFISPSSTFGYTAHALSGRPAFYLNIKEQEWESNHKQVCERAASLNACYHVKPFKFSCNDSVDHPFEDVNTWVPYVRQCQDNHFGLIVLPQS